MQAQREEELWTWRPRARSVSFMGDRVPTSVLHEPQCSESLSSFVSSECPLPVIMSFRHGKGGQKTRSEIIFEVLDSGPGIPPESQQEVFDKYKASKGGVGLGLYLSRLQVRIAFTWLRSGGT